jgi:hypothetical protein
MAAKYFDDNDYESQQNQRFLDIATEPRRMLMPIKGYERQPLVTLEEAVQPIVSMVPDVNQMVYVAKMKCQNPPADKLSLDESASIMLYSMEWEPQDECLYFVLNATLRSENRGKLTPWFLFLKLILTALARLPSSPRFAFRGIRRDMRKEYPEGSTVIWWGFSSCTANMGVLSNEQFLGSTGKRTLFTIECTSGKDIRHHSNFHSEGEILLPPGRQFQVLSCLHQSGGLFMIQLKEIESQYPLLEPVSKVSQSVVFH